MKKVEVINYEEDIPKRYRCFTILLYNDSSSYNFDDVMFNIRGYKYWAFVKHIPEDDELKVHYHVIIKLENATTCEAIAKQLGVPLQHVKYVRNIRAMCRYLDHLSESDNDT